MAMKTCKSCSFWDTLTVGERDQVKHDGYAPKRYCNLLSRGGDNQKQLDEMNSVEAAAQGIGGADITTGPDFGCIHHEQTT